MAKCRSLCAKYVERSKGCEPQYERALECQAGADIGELCTQVASVRCSEQFRAVKACERGEAAAESAPGKSLASWMPVEDGTLRFRTLLPPGVERDAAANAWRSTEDGIVYAVTVRDAPRPPLTHVALVRLVVAFVGYTCQKKLHLFGQYEDEGQTALRFSTQCHDGREYQGMLRVWDDLAFAQTAQGRAGSTPTPTEFFETFRRLPAAASAQPNQP